jgi:micrococcal nuclease
MARILLISIVVLACWLAPASARAATCSDYASQADEQRAADTRDADGDGIYCEALPWPCLKPGSGGGSTPWGSKPKPRRRAQRINARITSVVDGDTIRVRAFDARRDHYSVRLIGIDTPETKKPGVGVECGGPEATSHMLELAFSAPADSDGDGLFDDEGGDGRRVTLGTDASQDTFDRYGRLLAYVTTRSGRNLALEQLMAGWAKVYEQPFAQLRRFADAQAGAKAASRGVWDECGGDFRSEQ